MNRPTPTSGLSIPKSLPDDVLKVRVHASYESAAGGKRKAPPGGRASKLGIIRIVLEVCRQFGRLVESRFRCGPPPRPRMLVARQPGDGIDGPRCQLAGVSAALAFATQSALSIIS